MIQFDEKSNLKVVKIPAFFRQGEPSHQTDRCVELAVSGSRAMPLSQTAARQRAPFEGGYGG